MTYEKKAFLKCYECITDPVKRVKELFKNTENEEWMGGRLMRCKMIAPNVIGIASERGMDANMRCSLKTLLDGEIVFRSLHNDALVIEINGRKKQCG